MAFRWGSWTITLGAALLLGQPALGLGLVADDSFVSDGGLLNSTLTVTPDGLGLDESLFMAAAGFLEEIFDPETGESLGFVHVQGTSHYSITFEIHGDGDLALDGFARPLGGAGPVPSFLRVLAGSDVLYEREWENSATFDFATDLAPGLYTVVAHLGPASFDNDMGLELTYQVRDTAVPIPEPAIVLLLGLVSFAAARRAAGLR